MEAVAARRGDRLGAHHGSSRLLGGVHGADKAAVVNRELVLVHRGAVGFLTFDEDEPNGGRRHGQSEHRVHLHPLWTPTCGRGLRHLSGVRLPGSGDMAARRAVAAHGL